MKIVIIGGVAGGATAAARLRRLDESAEIIILERGGFVSYANCGLPYYIGGEIQKESSLTLQTPESFWKRFRIEVRVHHEVLSIQPALKTVTVRRTDTGASYEESYDELLLSPGAQPIVPKLPGVNSSRIFTLRTVEDTMALHRFIQQNQPRTAVLVGGGFIGLEMAENLVKQGIEVTLVEGSDHVMAPLDYDMACEVHALLRSKGIRLLLNCLANGFTEQEHTIVTHLKNGEALEADLVLLAIGVLPETQLAKEAGLTLGTKNAIVVNDKMQTSAPHIYAVGDAVEIAHYVTGSKTVMALAGPANKQGRIAADNICGRDSHFHGAQGSSVLQLFDMTIACTGVNEASAKAAGLVYEKAVTYSASHATYYPGATNMSVKALFNPQSGLLFGAQIVGFTGVDKRIDVLATAIRAGFTAADLTELELSYAPPYSSAKDPVNMLGFVIENVLNGTVKQYHWHDVATLPRDGRVTLLDTRTATEYALGHIDGTVNIPLDELRERLSELDATKPIYINCHSGLRSYLACRILSGYGFSCFNLSGGYRFYESIMRQKAFDATPTHPCGVKIN